MIKLYSEMQKKDNNWRHFCINGWSYSGIHSLLWWTKARRSADIINYYYYYLFYPFCSFRSSKTV